jgi:hypothetical protein
LLVSDVAQEPERAACVLHLGLEVEQLEDEALVAGGINENFLRTQQADSCISTGTRQPTKSKVGNQTNLVVGDLANVAHILTKQNQNRNGVSASRRGTARDARGVGRKAYLEAGGERGGDGAAEQGPPGGGLAGHAPSTEQQRKLLERR